MSLTLLKSGHYKCVYCDIIFKTEEAAKAHLKTPGHKTRRLSSKSSELSTVSSTEHKKTAKKETSRMEDSLMSERSASIRSATKAPAVPKKAVKTDKTSERAVKAALADSMSSYRSATSGDEPVRAKRPKTAKTQALDDAAKEYFESEYSKDEKYAMTSSPHGGKRRTTSDADESALSAASGEYLLDARQYNVIVAKLDQIIEKQNLLELRIQTVEQRQELAVRDRKKALQDAIDVDPVINENLQEIKRIEAAEKIIQDRLSMLGKSGVASRIGAPGEVRSTIRSQGATQAACPMCGSGSGW